MRTPAITPDTPHARAHTLCFIVAIILAFAASRTAEGQAQPSRPKDHPDTAPIDLPGYDPAPRTPSLAPRPPASQEPPAQSAPSPADREWFGGKCWLNWERATGDWGGARTALEDRGLSIAGSLTMDWLSLLSGGVNRHASTRRLLDVNATLDLSKLTRGGWNGATVYADFYHVGGNFVNDAGDFSLFTNTFAAQHRDQLAELWIEQKLAGNRIRLKFGKVNANKEFAFTGCAGTFLSSGTNWDQSIQGFPTYPDPATALIAFVNPTPHVYAGFGLFDGALLDGIRTGSRGPTTFFFDDQSSSWFIIGEAGLTWTGSDFGANCPIGKGRLAGGIWHSTHTFTRFDGSAQHGATGGYAIAEQQLLKRSGADDNGDKGLWVFGRLGFADSEVSPIRNHVGAGLVLKGTFRGRDRDECGVAFNWHQTSDSVGSPYNANERAVEAFYKIQLFGSVSIMPDVQWTTNPSGNNAASDAIVGTLRVGISF